MKDPVFLSAYNRGVQGSGVDYGWHWRVHVGLWAASSAAKLDGDFVECGVNRGFMSSAIMHLLDWNSRAHTFYLLDTFAGIDTRYLSDRDKELGVEQRRDAELASGFYTTDIEAVRKNFAQWPKAKIVVGPIPETLDQVDCERIAFLHLDLNCSMPEVAALDAFWDRLVPGAFVLMDDYAYDGYLSQKVGIDDFARVRNVDVLALPTGQGLLLKPAAEKNIRYGKGRCALRHQRSPLFKTAISGIPIKGYLHTNVHSILHSTLCFYGTRNLEPSSRLGPTPAGVRFGSRITCGLTASTVMSGRTTCKQWRLHRMIG